MRQTLRIAVACWLCTGADPARAEQPLDLDDPTPRPVFIDVESSANPATLGATWGPRFIGSFTSAGGVATVRLSAHATTKFLEFTVEPPFNPPSVSQPLEIRIDLASGAIETEAAGGVSWEQSECTPDPAVSESYALAAASDRVFGFTSASDPMLCALKEEWADYCDGASGFACALVPFMNPTLPYALCNAGTSFCPAPSCNFVPASPFDPTTGKLHVPGYRAWFQSSACTAFLIVRFSKRTDLRLLEYEYTGPVNAPALAPGAWALLAGLVAASGLCGLRRPRARSPLGHSD